MLMVLRRVSMHFFVIIFIFSVIVMSFLEICESNAGPILCSDVVE